MSKITITHEFDSIEEQEELKVLMRASMSYGVLWDIDQKLRGVLKYGEHKWLENHDVQNYLQSLRDEIHESGVFLDA